MPATTRRRRWRRVLRSPTTQIAMAILVMVGGAYLIAVWMVGLVLIVGGGLFAADALLRDVKPDDSDLSSHEAILRRYERSR